MDLPRASGILLHPTSLPGRFGIGELGSEAYRFVDFLAQAGQQLWQMMPLGPTGYGDSPYASPSAFAGNPLLISLEQLQGQGLLEEPDFEGMPAGSSELVDYGAVIPWKMQVLRRSFERWRARAGDAERAAIEQFKQAQRFWLDDYVLFMALQGVHGGPWGSWPIELVQRRPQALQQARQELAEELEFRTYLQFQFFNQWLALKRYANERGIYTIGDIPIFVAYDSSDAWANAELFYLDEQGNPTVVAGVPPDYFSETGQLWGNPLYRWDVMQQTGYRWWIERFRHMFLQFDIIRVDHFRGFQDYWEVPASEETAINGRWINGPGIDFFQAIERELGKLPIIAEDLGLITIQVEQLRDAAGLPGMRVLQFAFGGDATNPYLPHNYLPDTVVYTGTHDNDTTVGWWHSIGEDERQRTLRYIGYSSGAINWDLIRLALSSVARLAIVPLQDVLGLGSEARMNTPGREIGNWGWRYRSEQLDPALARRLYELSELYCRLRQQAEAQQAQQAEAAAG